MAILKKYLLIFLASLFLLNFFVVDRVIAANEVKIYFFRGQGCPHCAEEEKYLDTLKVQYPNIEVIDYEVWYSKDNQKLLAEVGSKMSIDISGVPVTIIGERSYVGFNKSSTANSIEEAVKYYSTNTNNDPVGKIINDENQSKNQLSSPANNEKKIPETISLPIIGEIKTKNFSLPLLTIVMGALDGFNPCSLWVLIFLISLLIATKSRKKMIIFGGAFILTEAISYAFFMTAWLNLILFIGFVVWVRFGIGVLALGGGGYNLTKYFKSRKDDSGCDVVGEKKRNKLLKSAEKIIAEKKILLALAGVITLAFSVNLVEMLCSAGIPAIYTQILSLSNLSSLSYAFYIILYIFFFMLDDLIVFSFALFTLRLTGISTKYTKYSFLIGGILMLIIGFLLIFKPSFLMF